jgi:hypothetical protein
MPWPGGLAAVEKNPSLIVLFEIPPSMGGTLEVFKDGE